MLRFGGRSNGIHLARLTPKRWKPFCGAELESMLTLGIATRCTLNDANLMGRGLTPADLSHYQEAVGDCVVMRFTGWGAARGCVGVGT